MSPRSGSMQSTTSFYTNKFLMKIHATLAFALAYSAALAQSNDLVLTVPATDVSFKMIKVEGGSFLMGAQKDAPDAPNYNPDLSTYVPDQTPVHEVTVPTFYIGEYEVTQLLWASIFNKNYPEEAQENWAKGYINYLDVMEFVEFLNVTFEDVLPDGAAFAIPTEEQWEYAARGGVNHDTYSYSGSNNYAEVAVYGGETEVPSAVGTKKPNSLGIYDMSGNALEWVDGLYSPDGYNGTVTNEDFRVLRGGGIHTRPNSYYQLKVCHRTRDTYNRALQYYGARVVINLPEKSEGGDATAISRPVDTEAAGGAELTICGGRLVVVMADGSLRDLSGRRL